MEAAGPQKMGSPALQARGTHTLCPRRWTSSPRPRLPHVGITPPHQPLREDGLTWTVVGPFCYIVVK